MIGGTLQHNRPPEIQGFHLGSRCSELGFQTQGLHILGSDLEEMMIRGILNTTTVPHHKYRVSILRVRFRVSDLEGGDDWRHIKHDHHSPPEIQSFHQGLGFLSQGSCFRVSDLEGCDDWWDIEHDNDCPDPPDRPILQEHSTDVVNNRVLERVDRTLTHRNRQQRNNNQHPHL